MYRMTAIVKSREEFKFLTQTYGQEFAKNAREWIKLIAKAASDKKAKPHGLSIGDLLDQVLAEETVIVGEQQRKGPETRWQHVRERLRDADWSQKLRAFAIMLTERQPPWELYTTAACFTCLGGVPIRVTAVYEINRVDEEVCFLEFDYDGEGSFGNFGLE
jgi:hypothetical protein